MKVFTAVNEGIKIEVKSVFNENLTTLDSYNFSYYINITNLNHFGVQLVYREWLIFDSLNMPRRVEGEGVVGLTPIIQTNETFSYNSWSTITTNFGKMVGTYTFINLITNEKFKAEIPMFDLVAPSLLN